MILVAAWCAALSVAQADASVIGDEVTAILDVVINGTTISDVFDDPFHGGSPPTTYSGNTVEVGLGGPEFFVRTFPIGCGLDCVADWEVDINDGSIDLRFWKNSILAGVPNFTITLTDIDWIGMTGEITGVDAVPGGDLPFTTSFTNDSITLQFVNTGSGLSPNEYLNAFTFTATHAGSSVVWDNAHADPNLRFFDWGNNWVGCCAPGPADTAQFDSSDSYEVWWDQYTPGNTPAVGFLHVLEGDVTFLNKDLTAQHELQINGAAGFSFSDLSISGPNTALTIDGIHLHNLGSAEIVADATVTIDGSASVGSTLTTNEELKVDGTLNVMAGGVVSNNGPVRIANASNSRGVATVTGAGSQWNSSGQLYVGSNGDGTLNVEAGGVVSTTAGLIGTTSGSTGVATITGAGSLWNNSSDLWVGNAGTGQLTVSGGGQVNSTIGWIGDKATGNGTATVTGAGSLWDNSSFISVGNLGTGQLMVSGGGRVNNTIGYIGDEATGNGAATVTGSASLWNNSDLRVGEAGTGQLTVSGGGRVDSKFGYVGYVAGSHGTATVTGPGSLWDNTTFLRVGHGGTGQMEVSGGGQVNSAIGFLGFDAGSDGMATVTGAGSLWKNSATLFVGYQGTGKLTVSGGGQVNNSIGLLGNSATGNGAATVTGAGSLWDNSSILRVGYAGTGQLTVSSGGRVDSRSGDIGSVGGSNGTATVTGAESLWEISQDLAIGGTTTAAGGTGVLNVNSGGTVQVAGTMHIWPGGTLAIELRGTPAGESDQLNHILDAGIADLGGTLDVRLINGFTPSFGDSFNIITATTVLDRFDTEQLPALAGALDWIVDYQSDSVSLLVGLVGDFDFDGDVDGRDFLVWQRGGSPNPFSASDLVDWEAYYGMVAPLSASSAAVPEPSGVVTVVIGVILMLSGRRQNRL